MLAMEANRWQRIEELFHLALQYDDAGREAYLAVECGEDQSLLAEVKSLISAHEESGEFLDKPQLSDCLHLMAAARETPSRAGQTIGRYELKKRIGRGGMGEVYLARDLCLERNVALKLLPASFNDHPEWIRRFQNEARAASSIAHPHIAHVYEIGEAQGQHYIAMEYIEGETLRERLRRERLQPLEALDIVVQVARALFAAHSAGVLHRDIKPDNIMLLRDGYVKVLDFGLAKAIPARDSEGLERAAASAFETGVGIIVGSPAYMSPEQARGQEVDCRSDLWSLGVLLYELLTQKSPFLSETPSDTMAAILKTEPEPLRRLVPDARLEIERVIKKLLAKRAEERYQSAESLIDELSRLAEGLKERKTLPAPSKQGASKHLFQRMPSMLKSWGSRPKPAPLGIFLLSLIVLTALLILKGSGHSATGSAAPPITSIAVLPFVNAQGDPGTAYISDGLSEGLIERFSRLSRIKVIARNSSFKYRTAATDIRSIARELGVQALVRGTVTQRRDEVQVSIELVDTRQGAELWSGQYLCKTTDLSVILNDITRNLAPHLNLGLSAEEMNLLSKAQKGSGNAYDWYLKGLFYWNQLTEESLDKSIECFNEALAVDPQYALAYTGLANSYIVLGANYRAPEEPFRKAELNARKALEIDDGLAEAHYAKAATRYLYYWDLPAAEKELNRSLELNPNFALANSLLCSLSLTKGDTKQATIYINRALELDPLSLLFNIRLSTIYYFQRDNERSIKLNQKILNENSNASFLYNSIAVAYAQMKRFPEALEASQRATILMGEDANTLSTLGVIYGLSGRTNEARWVAQTLEQLSRKKYVQAYSIASIYGAIGDKNQAFNWLEKAREQRASYMLRLKLDPAFDKVRSDPRYYRLLDSFNLSGKIDS